MRVKRLNNFIPIQVSGGPPKVSNAQALWASHSGNYRGILLIFIFRNQPYFLAQRTTEQLSWK